MTISDEFLTLIFTEYVELATTSGVCAVHFDDMNMCDGTIKDCTEKGKSKCTRDPECFGIMLNQQWTADLKGVKVCKSRDMEAKVGWSTILKTEKGTYVKTFKYFS